MADVHVPCPRCGETITVRFWEEAHPWGSTIAYEPMADFVDGCSCDLTEEEQRRVFDSASDVAPQGYEGWPEPEEES